MNPILDTTLQALGLKGTAPTKLDVKLMVDGIGRTLPMTYTTGNALASWLGRTGTALSSAGYSNHGTAYSIISYILSTAAPLPWAPYKLDGQDNKAKPQPKHPLAGLLYRPNPRQSLADFMTEAAGSMLLHGEVFIRKVRPEFSRNAGKTAELWVLNSHQVELRGENGMPESQLSIYDQPVAYRYTENGKWVDYPAEEIIHLKYWNPENPHRGLSPVSAGSDAITASKSGLVSRVTQYQNQGPPGVLHGKGEGEAWTAEQAGRVQDWFASFFTGGRRQGKIPVTNQEVGFISMGLSPVDLDVLSAIPHDKDAVADLWHFPGQLLNGSKGTTFSNMGEAGAALYSRCVIPLLTFLRDGLNRGLGEEYKDGVYLDFDTSHIPELQPNKEKLAQWLSIAWWVPVKEKQRMMGLPVTWDGDEYMVPGGYIGSKSMGLEPTDEVV